MTFADGVNRWFGNTGGKRIVGVTSLISVVVYVFASRGVSVWKDQLGYLTFVFRSFAAGPVIHAVPFQVPISSIDFAAGIAGLIASAASAAFVAHLLRGRRANAPLAVVAFLLTAVVPPMLIAAAAWPDGRGMVSSVAVAVGQVLFAVLIVATARSISGRAIIDNKSADSASISAFTNAAQAADLSVRFVRPLLWFASVFALLVLLSAIFSGIQGYDSFSDHLARPARWLVTGSLETGADGEVVTFYPGNFELLVRQTLLLGTDQLGFLVSFMSSIAAVWIVYRIAREIGQEPMAARFSAIAASSLQVLTYQSMVVYSDTFTAMCLLLATWLFLIWVRDGASNRTLSLGIGLALGLAMGSKYSAGPPSVVIVMFWAWYASRGNSITSGTSERDSRTTVVFDQRLIDIRALVRQGVWLVVGVLPGMLFWYLRNLVRDGNPLFPLSVAGLPGIPLERLLAGAPGPQGWLERITYPWVETGHEMGFETGLGPIVAGIVVLAVLATPFLWQRQRTQKLLWWLWLAAFIAWLRTGVLVPRYGLYPILLSFVFTGSFLVRFSSGVLRSVAAFCVIATFSGLGYQMLGGAAYHQLLYDPTPPVPAAIETLPPSRIFNLVGQPSGYYAMGHDYRHEVRSRFLYTSPEDMKRIETDYILLPSERDEEFASAMHLELVDRWSKPNAVAQTLWRVK